MNEEEKLMINPTVVLDRVAGRYAVIGDIFASALRVVTFPTTLKIGWMKRPLSFPGDMIIAFHMKKIKDNEVFNIIERSRMNFASYKMEEERHRKMPSYKVDRGFESTEQFSKHIASSNEEIFKVGIRTAVFARSAREIEEADTGLSARFGSVILSPLNRQQTDGLYSVIPIGVDRFRKHQLLSMRGVAGSLPIFHKEFQMKDGIVYGINPEMHSIIKLNEWEFPNAHILILGPSGFGKTFLAKTIVARSYLFRNETVYIIDQQGEYELLVRYLKGSYVDRTEGVRINPFDQRGSLNETVAFAKNFIIMLLGSVSQEEASLIEKAVFNAYERKKEVVFSDVIEELKKLKVNSVITRLIPYFEGVYAPYFNGKTNVDLQNEFTAFNYSRTPEAIKRFLVYLDFAYVVKKAFNERNRTRLLIDEGWTLLSNSIGQELVRMVFKTGRKFNLSVIFATQQIADIARTEAGRAILEQPTVKFLTTQNETSLPIVKQTFLLNDEQTRILQSQGRGAGILIVGDERFPLKVVASGVETKLFDTRPEQMRKNLEAFKRNGRLG